jgi:hypothetical protein
MEPKDLAFDSVRFDQCKYGVEYGKKEYTKYDKKGIKRMFAARGFI